MEPPQVSRPGLAEVVAVWILFALVAAAIWVTYSRLPAATFFNVSGEGFAGGAGRALVFSNYPVGLVAIAVLAVLAERLPGRLALATVPAALLCAVVFWPGVVEQSDLDPKAVNALPAAGVLAALGLTALVLVRGGMGASRPFGGFWDVVRVVAALVLLAAALPWVFADLGVYVGSVPGLGFFMSDEILPEPGHPDLRAVHLGHHHGLDGVLLALTAMALSRVVPDLSRRLLRLGLGFYLSLMLVYGLALALEDFWLEQLVKRGTTSARIPSMTVPDVSWAWAAILATALLIHFAARGVGRFGKPSREGVP